jgi:hypothetical protein
MSVEILGRHRRRHKKYFWHGSNPALKSSSLQESKETRRQTQCAVPGKKKRSNKNSLLLLSPPSGSPPYCLPKDPLLMYISAVSRPNTVLEVQVTREKPRSLIAAFRGIMMREIPGAL